MGRVFLGGTCNGSEWRDEMIFHLQERGLDYFNPVVDDWDTQAQENELRERVTCDVCLYVITPLKTGDYAIAEGVDDSNKQYWKTVLVFLREDAGERFDDAQWKSLLMIAQMVTSNGATCFDSLVDAADHIRDTI